MSFAQGMKKYRIGKYNEVLLNTKHLDLSNTCLT